VLDIVVKGGTIVDGSGKSRFASDVGIAGDRIAVVGNLAEHDARTVIPAEGLVVAPGLIDMHSHADYTLPVLPTADSKVHQGFTLEVVGNCGHSPAPLNAAMRREKLAGTLAGGNNLLWPGMEWSWDSFADFLAHLARIGTSVNVAPLVGHGAVRTLVLGEGDVTPTPDQLAAMKAEVRRAMRQGALGFSTGLIYPPGVYAATDEIVELARVAAEEGGIYTSHIRGESDAVLTSIDEAIAIARRAGISTQISHLKAAGKNNWPKMARCLELIEAARAEGLDVTADMYPYVAANTYIGALLPAKAQAGGREAIVRRLDDEGYRAEMRAALSGPRSAADAQWNEIYVSYCPRFPEYEGRTFEDIAAERGQPPDEAVLDILIETQTQTELIVFMMSEENVAMGLRRPYVMVGTDGEGRSADGPLSVGKPNPRNFGSAAKVLGKYARDDRLFSLEEAVRKMTGLPAFKLRLADRGLLQTGYAADLVIFDPHTVADVATFEQPHRYPRGIAWVVVNGQVVIDGGRHTGLRPGRIVSH
jgi:N-acyl-D-amino-acid deacylase